MQVQDNELSTETTESSAEVTESQTESQRLATPQEVLDYLVELFPQCFSKEGEAKPLKIGIFQELADRLKDDEKVSKTQLRGVLRHYTQSWRYLHAIKVGAHRVDLDGNQGDVLEEEHVEHAQQQLKESKQKFAEKRKAQQEKARGEKRSGKPPRKGPKGNKPKQFNKPKQDRKPQKPKQELNLAQAELSQLNQGQSVHVKVANSPMAATVTEVAKDGVTVQLATGMVVRTQLENILIKQ